MKPDSSFDTIVVGGGPAGSTAAAVLARRGRRVLLLEKERFPRYHIGESLLPYAWFTMERIGFLEKMNAAPFVRKYSVQFVSTNGKVSQPFYFFQHLKHEAAVTWQVLRSEFDHMLLTHAREQGADVREAMTVKGFLKDGDAVMGVWAVDEAGQRHEFNAPATIDASGRDQLAITKHNWRVRDPYLNKVALWTYFEGAMRDPGYEAGATTVAYLPERGWFWYIPLADDIISVGIVAEGDYLFGESRDLEQVYWREVERQPWIKEHVAVGRQVGPYYTTAEYSYRSRYCAADGLVLAGDAFQFLDPVFSSGVFLALRGGELAAEYVDAALEAGDTSAARFAEYGERICQGVESMRKLVYAFYDHSFSFRELLRKYPGLQGDVTDCLIGNLWRDFDPLFRAVEEFAAASPRPLEYGRQPAGAV